MVLKIKPNQAGSNQTEPFQNAWLSNRHVSLTELILLQSSVKLFTF
jgi:hypothetical protein